MNDEEAFEYWLESMRFRGDRPEGYERRAWRAACEWKQHEVDVYREAARTEAGFVNELLAENTSLKENINGTRMKQMNEDIERLKAENASLIEKVHRTKLFLKERLSYADEDKDELFVNKYCLIALLEELDKE